MEKRAGDGGKSDEQKLAEARDFIIKLASDAGLRDEASYDGIANTFYRFKGSPNFVELVSAFDRNGRIMQKDLAQLPAPGYEREKLRIDKGYEMGV